MTRLLALLLATSLVLGCASSPEGTPSPVPAATSTDVGPLPAAPSPIPSPTPTSAPVISPSPSPTSPPTTTSTPVPTPAPSPTATASQLGPLPALRAQRAFPGLTFQRLTNLAQPDDGLNRIFVTEQAGRILVFPNDPQVASAATFLDLRGKVSMAGNEEGLLGLAFDPDFKATGLFYVYYSAASPRRSILSRFSASRDNPTQADPASERVILEIPQPFSNHNGGQLAFGPDGYLYIGLGDGGGAGDPQGNGQSLGALLGKILRIDVRNAPPGQAYRVPPDNPFVGLPGARTEVWAYGLRNPWRFSFDPGTGLLWAADVGHDRWEEVDIVRRGGNYGWNVTEGPDCFSPRTGCDRSGLEPPVAYYSQDESCSITGGHVYRGDRLPSLRGAYLYADFCSGKLWGLRYDGRSVTEHKLLADTSLSITSFGVDLAGELYVLSRDQGIYRLAEE